MTLSYIDRALSEQARSSPPLPLAMPSVRRQPPRHLIPKYDPPPNSLHLNKIPRDMGGYLLGFERPLNKLLPDMPTLDTYNGQSVDLYNRICQHLYRGGCQATELAHACHIPIFIIAIWTGAMAYQLEKTILQCLKELIYDYDTSNNNPLWTNLPNSFQNEIVNYYIPRLINRDLLIPQTAQWGGD